MGVRGAEDFIVARAAMDMAAVVVTEAAAVAVMKVEEAVVAVVMEND